MCQGKGLCFPQPFQFVPAIDHADDVCIIVIIKSNYFMNISIKLIELNIYEERKNQQIII